jgi:hypothetical protein
VAKKEIKKVRKDREVKSLLLDRGFVVMEAMREWLNNPSRIKIYTNMFNDMRTWIDAQLQQAFIAGWHARGHRERMRRSWWSEKIGGR